MIFRYTPNGQEAVVPLESRGANAYILATGVATNSVSTQAVNIPVTIRDDTGAQIGTDTISPSCAVFRRHRLIFSGSRRGSMDFDAKNRLDGVSEA